MAKKIKIKALQKKIEYTIRDFLIKTRNNGLCEICKNKATEADHCFSRQCKELMFELGNLTAICKSCHLKKTHRVNAYDLIVYDHVWERGSGLEFESMRRVAERLRPFKDWSSRLWLEGKLKWAQKL